MFSGHLDGQQCIQEIYSIYFNQMIHFSILIAHIDLTWNIPNEFRRKISLLIDQLLLLHFYSFIQTHIVHYNEQH